MYIQEAIHTRLIEELFTMNHYTLILKKVILLPFQMVRQVEEVNELS